MAAVVIDIAGITPMRRFIDIPAPNRIVMNVIQLLVEHLKIQDHFRVTAFFPELVFLMDFMALLENSELVKQG